LIGKKELLSGVILAISVLFLANALTKPQPLKIVIEGGGSILINSPKLYSFKEVFALVLFSFAAGSSFLYLLLRRDYIHSKPNYLQSVVDNWQLKRISNAFTALKALEGPEKEIFQIILEKGGELLQTEICSISGYSKTKVSRILKKLEAKGLISRSQHGMTKKISLAF